MVFDFVTLYLDDLGVFSETVEQHLGHLRRVFERLSECNIKLKLKKCSFLQSPFPYLGYLVTAQGVQADPSKVEKLMNTPVPKELTELRSFLGLASYFRKFMPNYTEMVEPLQELVTKKDVSAWSQSCQDAFMNVKEIMCSEPVLKLPTEDEMFVLSTDASNIAMGAVLEQFDENNELRPVAYYSKKLSKAERNYAVFEREGLALVQAIKTFRCYLLGKKFLVYTDNSAVASLFKATEPTGRIARWVYTLSEFDYVLKHRAGKLNVVADYLSRQVMLCEDSESEITFAQIEYFLKTGVVDEMVDGVRFKRQVKKYTLIDQKLYRKTKSGFKKVLATQAELWDVLYVLHDQMGHFAMDTIWQWVHLRFWRPHLYAEVKRFVTSCLQCQKFTLRRPLYQFTGQSGISGIFGTWYFDFLGPFPVSEQGHRYVLTGIEQLSGYPVAYAVADTTSVTQVLGLEEVFSLFGIPDMIVADQGFNNRLVSLFCQERGIQLKAVPAYQPEWVGFVERLNGTIRYALTKMCDGDFSKWDMQLQKVLSGLRAKKSSRTGRSPYFVVFGMEPKLSVDDQSAVLQCSADARVMELAAVPGMRADLERGGKSANTAPLFSVGSFVLLLDGPLRKGAIVDKKKPRYLGPFKVTKVMAHNMYEIVDEKWKVAEVHVSRLIAFIPRSSMGGGVSAVVASA